MTTTSLPTDIIKESLWSYEENGTSTLKFAIYMMAV